MPSIAQLTAYNIDESETTDIHSIDSVTAEVAQYVEQHPPTGGTRPGFWLLKKQLRILKRALTTMTSHIYSVCAATSNNDMEKYNNKLFINKPPPPHRKDFVKENIALFPPPLRVAQAMAKAKKASMATAPVEEVQEEEDKLPVKVKGVLSIEEMICALAETKGSVGEVRRTRCLLLWFAFVATDVTANNAISLISWGIALFRSDTVSFRRWCSFADAVSPLSR